MARALHRQRTEPHFMAHGSGDAQHTHTGIKEFRTPKRYYAGAVRKTYTYTHIPHDIGLVLAKTHTSIRKVGMHHFSVSRLSPAPGSYARLTMCHVMEHPPRMKTHVQGPVFLLRATFYQLMDVDVNLTVSLSGERNE